MKSLLITEKPILVLPYSYKNGKSSQEELFVSDLKAAEPGDEFGMDFDLDSEVVRAERVKVIYKDEEGVSVLLTLHEKTGTGMADFMTKKAVAWIEFR